VIRDAAKKVKPAIIYAGGFAETGEKGKQIQMELARICEENQIRLQKRRPVYYQQVSTAGIRRRISN